MNAAFQKSLKDLNKYDWLIAVCQNSKHQQRTRDLRVAVALMSLADAKTMLAWPTQESIAELAGLSDPRLVRMGLASLAGTGAIEIVRLYELSEADREIVTAKRNRRGKCYRLSAIWAYEMFEAAQSPARKELAVKRQNAGARLAAARKKKAEEKRIEAIRKNRITTNRSKQDWRDPPYTSRDTAGHEESTEGTIDSTSTRASENAYAVASGKADP